jgi:hypothetical protein
MGIGTDSVSNSDSPPQKDYEDLKNDDPNSNRVPVV